MLILDEIVHNANGRSATAYKATLSNLNLVCRLFAHLVTPKLFARLTFAAPPTKELKRTHGARTAWLKQLARGERPAVEIAAMVKELDLDGYTPVGQVRYPAASEAPLWRRGEIVTYFPNLRSLALAKLIVTREFIAAMGSLVHLRSLSIVHCTFAPLTERCKPPQRVARLEHFEALCLDGVDPYIPELRSFIHASSIRSLKVTEWSLARALLQGLHKSRLEQLDVPFEPHDAAILFRFLVDTPTISDLSLVSTQETDGDATLQAAPPKISLPALPALRKLRCPPVLLPVLFSGGAVSRLSIMDIGDWMCPNTLTDERLLLPLKCSQIRDLEVPAWVFYHHPVHHYAPSLVNLSICFDIMTFTAPLEQVSWPMRASGRPSLTRWASQVVRDICALNRTSKLRGLRLRFFSPNWQLNLPLQHKMIMRHLGRACPAAMQISFDDAIEWQKELPSAKWRPVVRAREPIKELLTPTSDARKFIQVSDFDGVLAAVLDGDNDVSI